MATPFFQQYTGKEKGSLYNFEHAIFAGFCETSDLLDSTACGFRMSQSNLVSVNLRFYPGDRGTIPASYRISVQVCRVGLGELGTHREASWTRSGTTFVMVCELSRGVPAFWR